MNEYRWLAVAAKLGWIIAVSPSKFTFCFLHSFHRSFRLWIFFPILRVSHLIAYFVHKLAMKSKRRVWAEDPIALVLWTKPTITEKNGIYLRQNLLKVYLKRESEKTTSKHKKWYKSKRRMGSLIEIVFCLCKQIKSNKMFFIVCTHTYAHRTGD